MFADALVLSAAADERGAPNYPNSPIVELTTCAASRDRQRLHVPDRVGTFVPLKEARLERNGGFAQRPGYPIAAMVTALRNATVNQIPRTHENPHDKSTSAISPPPAPDRRLRRIHREP